MVFHEDPKVWQEADGECVKNGGMLAKVNSARLVQELLVGRTGKYYIGWGRDTAWTRHWKWRDGTDDIEPGLTRTEVKRIGSNTYPVFDAKCGYIESGETNITQTNDCQIYALPYICEQRNTCVQPPNMDNASMIYNVSKTAIIDVTYICDTGFAFSDGSQRKTFICCGSYTNITDHCQEWLCPPGFIQSSHDDVVLCLKHVAANATWEDARLACQADGASLLQTQDEDINTALLNSSVWKNLNVASVWLGLTDSLEEGNFFWVNKDNRGSLATWNNWAENEPNGSAAENCTEIFTNSSKWATVDCMEKREFICQYKEEVCPDGFRYISAMDMCLVYDETPVPCADAASTCSSKNGSLLIIDSLALSQALNQTIYSEKIELGPNGRNFSIWIGLTANEMKGVYKWQYGAYVNWSNWMPYHPFRFKDVCVTLHADTLLWASRQPSLLYPFVCQYPPRSMIYDNPKNYCSEDTGCQNHDSYPLKVVNEDMEWTEARDVCKAHLGELFKMDSAQLHNKAYSLASLDIDTYYWIGLSAYENAGRMQWTDGEVLNTWRTPQLGSTGVIQTVTDYLKTGLPEPYPWCISYLKRTNKWYKERCSNKHPFICASSPSVSYVECKLSMSGTGYMGKTAVTYEGYPCQKWSDQFPHEHQKNDSSLFLGNSHVAAENYCRNPGGTNPQGQPVLGPWCFTNISTIEWQLCDIPLCVSGPPKECKTSPAGEEYMGTKNTTIGGALCQAWADQSPHLHNYTKSIFFPDRTLANASNYCRNPNSHSGFTMSS